DHGRTLAQRVLANRFSAGEPDLVGRRQAPGMPDYRCRQERDPCLHAMLHRGAVTPQAPSSNQIVLVVEQERVQVRGRDVLKLVIAAEKLVGALSREQYPQALLTGAASGQVGDDARRDGPWLE